MNENKSVVSKGKIRVDNSDGTYSELEFVMPEEISQQIFCRIIGWKEEWYFTMEEAENYKEAEKEFLENPKAKQP